MHIIYAVTTCSDKVYKQLFSHVAVKPAFQSQKYHRLLIEGLAAGATVDVAEDGLVTIASANGEALDKALNWIKSLVEEPEVGKIYDGTVVTIKDFGAFVNILPGIDGMLHISQISDKRIDKVEDALEVGQKVRVRLDAIDDKGRLSLSMRHID